MVGAENNPRLSLNPQQINFGDVPVGLTISQVITLTNSGNASVTARQLTVSGSGFSADLELPITLAPGQRAMFNVRYAPAEAGSVTGGVSLVSSASNSPTTISLAGNGASQAPPLVVSPTSINFGDVVVGDAISQSVTVANTGTADVTLNALQATGGGLTVGGLALPTTLAPAQAASFNVRFVPPGAGSTAGSASLETTVSATPTSVSLSGNGLVGVNLLWDQSPSAVAGYNLYRSRTSGGAYAKLNFSLILGTNFTDRTVQAGSTYFYVATAVDAEGIESIFSNELQVQVR